MVVAPIHDGFSLQRMGTPEEAAAMFLQTTGEWMGGGGGGGGKAGTAAAARVRFRAAPLTACPSRPCSGAVAPEGSGRTAALLGAGSRRDADGELYYWQEFTVQKEAPRPFNRHNLSGGWEPGVEGVGGLARFASLPTHSSPVPLPPATQHIAVYAARNGLLYTLNCQCAEERWEANAAAFRKAADSFTILNEGAAAQGYPDRL